MNRIVKVAALLVALTVAFSFSQENPSLPTEKSIASDPINTVNLDSITLKTLKDVEAFYSNSFKDIHNSYSFFLTCLAIGSAIICAILGIVVTILGIAANRSREDLKERLKEVEKDLDEYKEIKKEFEKIKKEFENEKNSLEKNRKDLDENCKEIYGEIEYTYFSLAISNFRMKFYEEHFMMLAEHFATFRKRNIKPERIDLNRLIHFDNFIKEYGSDKIEIAKIFFYELDRFIKHGDTVYTDQNRIDSKFLEDIKEIRKKIYESFGGKNNVLEAIKNFESHL
ncbi:MAG: hypothetical protein LBC75_11240 [Fibromonadaceae bacterium]|jgi:uncharacterized membrane-anchored protein YhcB (DUF1043 family)|nr:hypothetical protein [Fibromonadaceae bacterium]